MQIKRPHWLFPWRTELVQVMQYGNLVACFQQMPTPVCPLLAHVAAAMDSKSRFPVFHLTSVGNAAVFVHLQMQRGIPTCTPAILLKFLHGFTRNNVGQ